MRELLFISNISQKVDSFSIAAIYAAKKSALNFHYASNWDCASEGQIDSDEKNYGIMIHNVSIKRSPFSLKNLLAFRQILDILSKNNIQFIHCNTPVGGVMGRLANKKVKKVIYEAHGFHFYKGAPLINWILYYPVERYLSKKTDAIITINRDDYEFALKHLHPRSKIYYVPGVGIELQQWEKNDYNNFRKQIGLNDDDFVVLVVGRLEKNKNCKVIIEALSKIKNNKVKLVFCGDGEDFHMLEKASKALGNRVIFLGNQKDMCDIYHMSNCFVMASFREGLSRSIMEAMACGLPCIVSDIRGNRDLIDAYGGFLFNPSDSEILSEYIMKLYKSRHLCIKMRNHNLEKIQLFSVQHVINDLVNIYEEQFG